MARSHTSIAFREVRSRGAGVTIARLATTALSLLLLMTGGCSGDERAPRSDDSTHQSPAPSENVSPISPPTGAPDTAGEDGPRDIAPRPRDNGSVGVPWESRQVLLVTTGSWRDNQGTVRRFSREQGGGRWHQVQDHEDIVVRLGRSGLAWGRGLHPAALPGPVKVEGDQRTPAGVFDLGEARGFADVPPPGTTWPFLHSGKGWRCMDDVKSPAYNTFISTAGMLVPTHAGRARREDLFHWMIFVLHNTDPVQRGAGSCVFLHVWASPASPTQGCIAMDRSNLAAVLPWLQLDARPVLAVLPLTVERKVQPAWDLPSLP